MMMTAEIARVVVGAPDDGGPLWACPLRLDHYGFPVVECGCCCAVVAAVTAICEGDECRTCGAVVVEIHRTLGDGYALPPDWPGPADVGIWRSGTCRDRAPHDLDFNLAVCRRCFLTFEALHALAQIDPRIAHDARVVGLDPTPGVFMADGCDNPQCWNTRAEVAALEARCDGPERCAAIHTHTLLPSDLGVTGAIPLPDDDWHPAFTDEGWAAQNRKINDLLMGRAG